MVSQSIPVNFYSHDLVAVEQLTFSQVRFLLPSISLTRIFLFNLFIVSSLRKKFERMEKRY